MRGVEDQEVGLSGMDEKRKKGVRRLCQPPTPPPPARGLKRRMAAYWLCDGGEDGRR
jgi:hypothetical protein